MFTQGFDTPLRNLTGRALLSMTTLLLVSLTMIPSAIAGPRDRNLTARFSELQVAHGDHRVVVKYTLTTSSWNAFKHAEIEPRLNIYSLGRHKAHYVYRYSTELRRRSGKIIYTPNDVRLRDSKTVEIEVIGFGGPKQIARSSYGTQTSERLRLGIRDKRESSCEDDHVTVSHPRSRDRNRGGDHRGARQAEIIRACDANTTFNSEMNKCLHHADKLAASNAVAVINACGKSTFFDSHFRKCLDGAAKISVAPASTVKACDDATDFGLDFTKCMTKSASYKHSNPAPVVRACGRHTDFGSDLGKCIDSARGVRGNKAEVVDVCGRATNFGSELLGCVARSRGRRT
jgi:hypothetical protein